MTPIRDMLCITLTLALAGCSNPLNFRVSKLTKDQRAELHADLTADQSAELDAWVERHTVGGAALPADVTVDKALKDQEAWMAKQQAEKDKAAELQKRRMESLAAKQRRLASLLSVALLSKTNRFMSDDRKFVALDLEYANNTDKDIAAIKGAVNLVNIYGEPVISFDWDYNHPITSKQTVIEHNAGIYMSTSAEPPQVELWDTDFNRLKLTFEIKTIMFKDGTSAGES